jgi:UDP:flavonoid glycosyltransferase YjiC (YdhE family)
MRVLFTAAPGYGLMLPLVPLAWAARAAGHEVLLATTAHMKEVGAESGLSVADVFPQRDIGSDLVAGAAGTAEPTGGTPPGYWELVSAVRPFELFTLAMTEGTIGAGREFGADLVVYCSDHMAGKLAAIALGVPALEVGNRVSWSLRDAEFRDGGEHDARTGILPDDAPVVTALRERLGLRASTPDLVARIDPRAPSMGGLAQEEPDAADGVPWRPMRYVPFNGGAVLPGWAMRRPERPRICLTLGTVAPLLPGGGGLGLLIEALSGLDADVMLADGETDLSRFGTLPDNLHPAGFVPLSGILRDCSLVVHHGGSGTTAAALHHGVPQLVVPGGADNALCAQRVVDRKVGLSIEPSEADVPAVRTAVERLLTEKAFADAAAEVRAEIAGQPSPAAVFERIAADLEQRGRAAA